MVLIRAFVFRKKMFSKSKFQDEFRNSPGRGSGTFLTINWRRLRWSNVCNGILPSASASVPALESRMILSI